MTTASARAAADAGALSADATGAHAASRGGVRGRVLTEQHWAIIFLLAFALCAVVVAFVAKQIIDYTAGGGGGAGGMADSISSAASSSGVPVSAPRLRQGEPDVDDAALN